MHHHARVTFFFFFKILFSLIYFLSEYFPCYVCYVCMYVRPHVCLCPHTLEEEEAIGAPRTEVTDSCELPSVGARN